MPLPMETKPAPARVPIPSFIPERHARLGGGERAAGRGDGERGCTRGHVPDRCGAGGAQGARRHVPDVGSASTTYRDGQTVNGCNRPKGKLVPRCLRLSIKGRVWRMDIL
jgi:hypothetical protein